MVITIYGLRGKKNMNILHTVEFYYPSIGGAQEVVRQISERLVKRGHQVTIATTRLSKRNFEELNGVRIKEFSISGNDVRGITGTVEQYQSYLLSGDFDVMMNYAAQEWTADLAFPLLAKLPYPAILVPCGFSGLYDPQYKDYFKRIEKVLRQYNALIFHAGKYRDIEFARQLKLKHLYIIPNGAAADEFERNNLDFRKRFGISADTPLLLTVGTHTGVKGHRLVMEAFRRSSLKNAVLVVIGNRMENSRGCYWKCKLQSMLVNLSGLGKKQVMLMDLPREWVVAAYRAADLFIFGSNIEYSPLVFFEAMAAHTPFVTLSVGNAEEIIELSHGGILLPTRSLPQGYVDGNPTEMAREIERLLGNELERTQLGEAGYNAWRMNFDWEIITDKYETLYREIVGET